MTGGSQGVSIAGALDGARRRIPVHEARRLLRHLLGCAAAYLEAHREEALTPACAEGFLALVARRATGEPLAYLIGRREFFGRDFVVTPAVLIPRPETELLVELGVASLKTTVPGRAPRILDLGTGSGCVAVSLAAELPQAQVTAVDMSAEALAVARQNAARHAVKLTLLESDWFAALGAQRYDLIVSNPPYVASGDPHLEQGDLRFEPALALACGSDGLAAIRRIISSAPGHLQPGGWLLLEHGYDQAEAVHALLQAAGYQEIQQHRDLSGILRVSAGRQASAATN